MAVLYDDNDDELLPWLKLIKKALDDFYLVNNNIDNENQTENARKLDELSSDCWMTFKHNAHYKDDIRFLKICLLYVIIILSALREISLCLLLHSPIFTSLGGEKDYEKVYREIEDNEICIGHSSLYEWYALFLEAQGELKEANVVYQIGISRNAEPLGMLKGAQSLFIQRMQERVNNASCLMKEFVWVDDMKQKLHADAGEFTETGNCCINPWSPATIEDLFQKIAKKLAKYDGYRSFNKAYPGKVALSTLPNTSRNKIIEIGGMKYHIKGCAGQGGFAKVYKGYADINPDELVALKVQKPPFPWEFYMYRQLDQRIPDQKRSNFGVAQRMQAYSDYSILVCDYLSNGTLQDTINSYVVTGKFMEEVLCIYYTIEMLRMLETLHGVGIIHGDFKPDNLLVRYARNGLTEDGFYDRSGPWSDQGLCLVDWGRAIDLHLFPHNTEFKGDCRTSGFRCVEMREDKPWKFQVDRYGLCVIAHMMLHGSYMEIEKKASNDGYVYQPKASFKRYWKVDLWKNFFTKLLNNSSDEDDISLLRNLRESFEDYIRSEPNLLKNMRELLTKQKASLCG
ncbi:hypothetical protein ACFE04_030923 [Oxalis oulophora]